MKFQKIVGTFYKSLFILIIINLFACATVKNEATKTEIVKNNLPKVNNLSLYYFTMAETAIQEGDINLALQLYMKADAAASGNIYIKEIILQILELTMGQDKENINKIIKLGNEYLQDGLISEKILGSLANGFLQAGNGEKFVEILDLQLEKYPSMHIYTMKYYAEIQYNDKKNYKLLEKALECEWEDINKVMAIIFELPDDEDKMLDIVEKSYLKWTEEEITHAELEEQYKTLGVNLLLTNLIQATLESDQKLGDQTKEFFLSILMDNGKYEQIVEDLPHFINTNSTRVLELLFVATLEREEWNDAAYIGKNLFSRKDLVSFKYVVMNLAVTFSKLGENRELLFVLAALEDVAEQCSVISEVYPNLDQEGKDYFQANLAQLSEEPNRIEYIQSLIEGLEENYSESMKHLQEIPDAYLLENNLLYSAMAMSLDANKVDKAVELLTVLADTTLTIIEHIGVYYQSVGELDLALKFLQQELEGNPNVSQNTFLLCSNICNNLEEKESALEYLDKGLLKYPESSVMLNSVGYTIADHQIYQRYDEAEKYIKKALEKDPKNFMIWDSLAWLYFRQGEYQKALDILNEHCLESLKDSAISYHFAEVYLKLNNLEMAKKYLIGVFVFNNDESAIIASEKLWKEYFSTDSIEENIILEKE